LPGFALVSFPAGRKLRSRLRGLFPPGAAGFVSAHFEATNPAAALYGRVIPPAVEPGDPARAAGVAYFLNVRM
jgi:hypothetical protein